MKPVTKCHFRAPLGPVSKTAEKEFRPGLQAGAVVLLGAIEPSPAEREAGTRTLRVFGIVAGRCPWDPHEWIVVPADHVPLSGPGDLFLPSRAGLNSSIASLWVRPQLAFLANHETLDQCKLIGSLDVMDLMRVARHLVRTKPDENGDYCDVIDPDGGREIHGFDLPSYSALVSSVIPGGSKSIGNVLTKLRKQAAEGGLLQDAAEVTLEDARKTPVRLAAADGAGSSDDVMVFQGPDMRIVRVRHDRPRGLVWVMPDMLDDVIEVLVCGRRAEALASGYRAVVMEPGDAFIPIDVIYSMGVRLCIMVTSEIGRRP